MRICRKHTEPILETVALYGTNDQSEKGDFMFIKSTLLRSPHEFCRRNGGVSREEHTKSLNLAFFRGDEDDTVLENLRLFADSVGFDPQNVISLPQIHSDIIYKVGKEDTGQGYFVREALREGDGYITNERNVVLGVKAADCVPILFEAEKDGQILAVGAVHAGWRGTVAGIAPKCVEMLCREYRLSPQAVRAAIGPCIHKCCYEVGSDLKDAVDFSLGKEISEQYVTACGDGEHYFCDLPGINRELLLHAGLPQDNIDTVNKCTCCEPSLFYSHRYTKGVRGTMLNVILMK